MGLYYLIVKSIKPYTYKKLYDEIIELSKPHSYAIILIRNDTKHRFLLFKNPSWDGCRLFVNYNMDNIKKPKQNTEALQKRLSEDFDILPQDIEINYFSSITSRKWSYNDKTTKIINFIFSSRTLVKFLTICHKNLSHTKIMFTIGCLYIYRKWKKQKDNENEQRCC